MGAQLQRGAYSRVCGASTAKRPAALGYAGAGTAHPSTTMFTSRFSTYTTFLIVFPLIHSTTFASAFAVSTICLSFQSAGALTLLRGLPFPCQGVVPARSRNTDPSHGGHGRPAQA